MSAPATRRFVRFGFFAVPSLSVLLGLGFWQLARLEWKESLLNDLAAIATAEAQNLAQLPPLSDGVAEDGTHSPYQKVFLHGRFISEAAVYVGPRRYESGLQSRSGGGVAGAVGAVGAWVFEPFLLQNADTVPLLIWVARGWVPFERASLTPRPPPPHTTPSLRFEGITRPAAYKGYEFLRPPAPQANSTLFTWPDLEEMQARQEQTLSALGILAPFRTDLYVVAVCDDSVEGLCVAVDETARASGLEAGLSPPLALAAIPSLRNAHRDYAIIWFALALALLAIWLFLSFAPPREVENRANRANR
ncbi:MAG: hypothetical protein OD811_04155 [Alphaproteobacteria bacterium]